MGKYCLIKSMASEFRNRLKSGQINPEKLAKMTSKERRKFLGGFLDEKSSKNVNALFEKKLLQKNRWNAMLNWAKEATGIKPEVKRDLISRIEKMSKDPKSVLSPKVEDDFLQDLASAKLGIDVSYNEAKKITEISDEMSKARSQMKEGGDSLRFGSAKVAMENYLNDIRIENKVKLPKDPLAVVSDIAGASKGIKASLDNSAIFRQGWKTLWTNPKIWAKNAKGSFADIANTFKDKDVMSGIKAEIYSRKNSIDGTYNKMKLDVGDMEEAFPSTLPEKIPLFKKLYKASENAYTGFLYKTRADLADNLLKKAKDQGVDITNEVEARSIGKLINSLTGRGALGKLEPISKEVNTIFFSPKFLKSNIDVLTAHVGDRKMSKFARKEASQNLMKIVGGTTAILLTANAIRPGSVDFDPRSSNFGKIKIGDTRFDITGGMASIITLASRLALQSTKSASTGKISELGGGFGSKNGMDVFWDFWEGKLSPAGGLARNILQQETFLGDPLTLKGEVANLFLPMPIANFQELRENPNSAPVLMGMIADGFGIGTNTYAPGQVNWAKNPGVELQAFQKKVGEKKFKEANLSYNKTLAEKIEQLKGHKDYKKLSGERKQKVLSKVKSKVKDSVFKKYRFKYIKPKTKKDTSLDSMIKSLNVR